MLLCSSGAGSREERPGLLQARADGARRGALSGGGVRHMLLQDLLLGDLGCASEWASVGRPAGAHRDAGPAARNASTQRSRRHSCRLSSSVTVRGTSPLLGVCANACLLIGASAPCSPQSLSCAIQHVYSLDFTTTQAVAASLFSPTLVTM